MKASVREQRADDAITPKVGAVLWKPDGTIEIACRGELREGDHAEYTLIERKNGHESLADCVLFATLEPCGPDSRHERLEPHCPQSPQEIYCAWPGQTHGLRPLHQIPSSLMFFPLLSRSFPRNFAEYVASEGDKKAIPQFIPQFCGIAEQAKIARGMRRSRHPSRQNGEREPSGAKAEARETDKTLREILEKIGI